MAAFTLYWCIYPSIGQLESLAPAAARIIWPSLARTNISDEWLSTISKFENLTRLQLEKTSISDAGVAALAHLKHLEVLNLYNTKVTDTCLPYLQVMEGLIRVYVWDTQINPEMANNMQEH